MDCFSYSIFPSGLVSQVIFLTASSVLFLCSLIGNSVVIYLVWGKSALWNPTYFLISFLALSDLSTSLLGQFSAIISLAVFQDINCKTEKLLIFMHASNCICSLLLLSLIARDRYLRVSKQNRYQQHTNNRFAITGFITCYIFGLVVAATFMLESRIARIWSPITLAVVGSFSFTFICLKSRQIVRIIKDHSRKMQLTFRDRCASERNAVIRSRAFERSVNRSIFAMIILFFASWTPIIIIMTIITIHNILNQPIVDDYRIAVVWATVVSYFNGALNPIIYSYRCDAIGREIRRILAKVARRNRTAPSTTRLEEPRKTDVPQDTVKYNKEMTDADYSKMGIEVESGKLEVNVAIHN